MKPVALGILFVLPFLMADGRYIPLYVGESKLIVEVADTPEKRMTGLMFRKSIPDDYGMLFVFESESVQAMWMKNTLISLDIVFLNTQRQVVDIHRNVPPCRRDPCESYVSRRPAKYALELKGRHAEKLNIEIGDLVFFVLHEPLWP